MTEKIVTVWYNYVVTKFALIYWMWIWNMFFYKLLPTCGWWREKDHLLHWQDCLPAAPYIVHKSSDTLPPSLACTQSCRSIIGKWIDKSKFDGEVQKLQYLIFVTIHEHCKSIHSLWTEQLTLSVPPKFCMFLHSIDNPGTSRRYQSKNMSVQNAQSSNAINIKPVFPIRNRRLPRSRYVPIAYGSGSRATL
jgi:hypothetical protein